MAYDDQMDRTILAAIGALDLKLEKMIAGFNVMIDLLQSTSTAVEGILSEMSAEPDAAENPVAAAMRQLASIVLANTRASEAMATVVQANTLAIGEMTTCVVAALNEET